VSDPPDKEVDQPISRSDVGANANHTDRDRGGVRDGTIARIKKSQQWRNGFHMPSQCQSQDGAATDQFGTRGTKRD
jgi:hypothetical protein